MTTHWDYRPSGDHDAVREVLGAEVTLLQAQRAELIVEVETMRARLGAWRECARQGVRLVEHITVTQSTDGQWAAIAKLYEWFDELHDAEADEAAPALYEYQTAMASAARAKAAR